MDATSEDAARLLIVDASTRTRALYKRLLSAGGLTFTAVETATVSGALEHLGSGEYDCMLMGFRLPDGDGLELLNRVQRDRRPRLPVVMITGQGSEPVAVAAMKLGAKDYLVKNDLSRQRLTSAVKHAIAKARTERERRVYRRELEQKSVTDSLTGLYNRLYLFEQLDKELHRTRRYGLPLSLLMIDLDCFKSLNDTFGHLTGDRVLENFAGMLMRVARRSDIVSRYGGEEFCIVLTNTDSEGGLRFAERIRTRARALRHESNTEHPLIVTCSIGVAASDESTDGEVLVERADQAMYRAKRAGRDRVALCEEPLSESA